MIVVIGYQNTETPNKIIKITETNVLEKSVESTNITNSNLQIITISGVDKSEEVKSDIPIKLVISGIRNYIKINENTQVKEIVVSGNDITIDIPKQNSPQITDSGIRTKINYYQFTFSSTFF